MEGDKSQGKVVDQQTGELITTRDEVADYFDWVQDLKLMLVTKELKRSNGKLFDATIQLSLIHIF